MGRCLVFFSCLLFHLTTFFEFYSCFIPIKVHTSNWAILNTKNLTTTYSETPTNGQFFYQTIWITPTNQLINFSECMTLAGFLPQTFIFWPINLLANRWIEDEAAMTSGQKSHFFVWLTLPNGCRGCFTWIFEWAHTQAYLLAFNKGEAQHTKKCFFLGK